MDFSEKLWAGCSSFFTKGNDGEYVFVKPLSKCDTYQDINNRVTKLDSDLNVITEEVVGDMRISPCVSHIRKLPMSKGGSNVDWGRVTDAKHVCCGSGFYNTDPVAAITFIKHCLLLWVLDATDAIKPNNFLYNPTTHAVVQVLNGPTQYDIPVTHSLFFHDPNMRRFVLEHNMVFTEYIQDVLKRARAFVDTRTIERLEELTTFHGMVNALFNMPKPNVVSDDKLAVMDDAWLEDSDDDE